MRRLAPALAALALLAASCGAGADDGATPPAQTAPTLPANRLELPNYDLERFEELLATLEGTPVVVNIWAAWCGPCRVEAPHLAEAARDYEGEVQFLGVDILDSRRKAERFILEFDWPYPSVYDPSGEIRDGLGFVGQPITFILDEEGERVFEWSGAVTEELLREEIDKVLA